MTQYVSFNISIFRLLIKKLQTKTLTWIIHDKNPQASNKYFVFHLIPENIWRFCHVNEMNRALGHLCAHIG